MSVDYMRFSINDGVGRIVLSRPEQANTVDLVFAKTMLEIANICKEDPSVRAVLLSAEEGPIFCAGGDLATFKESGDNLPDDLAGMIDVFHSCLEVFSDIDAPLVVAVNGMVAGIGLSFVLSASVVIASKNSRFTTAYTGAGLTPDGGVTYYLPRVVGFKRAEEMILTNRQLSAVDALQWGIINQLVEEEELMETSLSVAKRLAAGPTKAYGSVRRLLSESFLSSRPEQMDREKEAIVNMTKTADGKEGINAFLDKRRPLYTGN